MAGNIADKARYALREYDVRRGGGCDWYVKGYDGVEHKLRSCVYDQWGANSPSKVVRVLKEAVTAAGIRPKTWVAEVTPLEKYEGTLYDTPEEYAEVKREYADSKAVAVGVGDEVKIGGLALIAGFFVVVWILLFGSRRR